MNLNCYLYQTSSMQYLHNQLLSQIRFKDTFLGKCSEAVLLQPCHNPNRAPELSGLYQTCHHSKNSCWVHCLLLDNRTCKIQQPRLHHRRHRRHYGAFHLPFCSGVGSVPLHHGFGGGADKEGLLQKIIKLPWLSCAKLSTA